nr:hypothetical protein BaRGS_031896 [Batillaria attramentaria]
MVRGKQLALFLVSIVTIGLMMHTALNLSYLDCAGAVHGRVMLDDSAARVLHQQVKVLCWIPSIEKQLYSKVRAVNDTWVRRCDKHVFFINTQDNDVSDDVVKLDVPDGYYNLTKKSMAALSYLYQHHGRDYDWFLKGDDDAYVVMENLKFLLSHYDPSEPVYLGHLYKMHHKEGYMSGGASYAISREALRLVNEQGIQKDKCAKSGRYEDVEVAKCLHTAGVASHVSRDRFGRDMFHPLRPRIHIVGPIPPEQVPQDRFPMVANLI